MTTLPWVKNVPAHWRVVRLKYACTYNDDVLGEDHSPSSEILYVDISNVDEANGIGEKMLMAFGDAPSRARRKVRHGDVIISTVRTYLRAIALIRDPEPNLVVSTGFAVIRPRVHIRYEFLGYVLAASFFIEQVISRSTGISYPAINASELANIPIPLPPLAEQQAIAAYLDRETSRIDGLIADQRRLIELLRERRAAVVAHAVTKGLDPSAPLRDSGVAWLGEVPGHWSVVRLKHASTYNDDVLGEDNEPTSEILYVDISNVDAANGIAEKVQMAFGDAPSRARRIVRHGDVIISTVRTYLRAIAPIRDPEPNLVVSTGFAVIRPRSRIRYDFLGYVLAASFFIEDVISRSTGVSYPAINASELVNIPIPLPPLAEQIAIAAYLDRETARIDGLIADAERSIDLLGERRAAVISAAVRGDLTPGPSPFVGSPH